MGCFDAVIFKCPKCNNTLEEQSKAGECGLRDYNEHRVPIVIADDLVGEILHCYDCDTSFRIYNDSAPKYVPLSLEELNNIDD